MTPTCPKMKLVSILNIYCTIISFWYPLFTETAKLYRLVEEKWFENGRKVILVIFSNSTQIKSVIFINQSYQFSIKTIGIVTFAKFHGIWTRLNEKRKLNLSLQYGRKESILILNKLVMQARSSSNTSSRHIG